MKLGGAINVPCGVFSAYSGWVHNGLSSAKDRSPRGVLVVDAGFRAQLGADQRAHVGEHLVGELACRQLLRDAGVVFFEDSGH